MQESIGNFVFRSRRATPHGFYVAGLILWFAALIANGIARPAAAEPTAAYDKVADLIDRESFTALQPIHRQMLVNFADRTADAPAPPFACFTPGYPDKAVAAFEEAVWGRRPSFQIANRWTATATNPGGLSQGDPTVITYSFVPDGTPIGSGIGEPASPSDMFAFFDSLFPSTSDWQDRFHEVFDRWGELTGNTYVFEPNDDGATLGNFAGQLGVRGDVRIGGHFIDGQTGPNVLAFNFFPNNGDMVIDTGNPGFYGNLSNNSRALRNVVAHEHGHGLGLAHTCPINETKLMEPFITTLFDGPQLDDVLGGQRSYGDANEPNDGSGAATTLGTLDAAALVVSGASIDDETDKDFYAFSMTGAGTIDLALRPAGTVYLEGQQLGLCSAGAPFNSLVLADLGVEVLAADGSTVLASSDVNPAGLGETLAGLALPSAGAFFVRVFTNDANGDVQLYELELNPSAEPEIEAMLDSSPIVNDNNVQPADFGRSFVDDPEPELTLAVFNTGFVDLNVSGVTLPAGLALAEGLNATIPPGGMDDFTVALDTSARAIVNNVVEIASDDGDEGNYRIHVAGEIFAEKLTVDGHWIATEGYSSLGTNSLASFGTTQAVYELHAADDDENLFLMIEGNSSFFNGGAIYLDFDATAGSGSDVVPSGGFGMAGNNAGYILPLDEIDLAISFNSGDDDDGVNAGGDDARCFLDWSDYRGGGVDNVFLGFEAVEDRQADISLTQGPAPVDGDGSPADNAIRFAYSDGNVSENSTGDEGLEIAIPLNAIGAEEATRVQILVVTGANANGFLSNSVLPSLGSAPAGGLSAPHIGFTPTVNLRNGSNGSGDAWTPGGAALYIFSLPNAAHDWTAFE